MVNFIIDSIGAEKENKPLKEYHFGTGINVVQSEKTGCGKTTLMGIIDYCFNGKSVFPWTNIEGKYDSVFIKISINDKKYLIRRGLKEDKEIRIFDIENENQQIKEDITDFFLRNLGIKHSEISVMGKRVKISIRDYLKLFFIRQLDTKNLSGDFVSFNKVVQAGKVVIGLEEKGLLETMLKQLTDEVKGKGDYLTKLKLDLNIDIISISDESLNEKQKELEIIDQEIRDFEKKLTEGKNTKIPMLDKIKNLEDNIRKQYDQISSINEEIMDIDLLKKDIHSDFELIKKAEISLEILKEFPDTNCPECKRQLTDSDSKDLIYCKICGNQIDQKEEMISNFYTINKNTDKDLDSRRITLLQDKTNNENKLKEFQKDYDDMMKELYQIEKSIISRFTTQIKESMRAKEYIIKQIEDLRIKLNYKNLLLKYQNEISEKNEESKKINQELEKLNVQSEIFKQHQDMTRKFLLLSNYKFEEIDWKDENIFPSIDKKRFLELHGGSNYVRILTSVLSSLFELSLENKNIKLPSVLIIDSIRKHEIELEDLKSIANEWIKSIEKSNMGQIILTGIDIPDNIINKAKEQNHYYFIPEGNYTL